MTCARDGFIETTQTIRGLLRGGKLSVERADLGVADLGELAVRRHPDVALLKRAWDLRDTCTIDDGLYVALAEALDATLVTRDRKLARGIADRIPVSTV